MEEGEKKKQIKKTSGATTTDVLLLQGPRRLALNDLRVGVEEKNPK